jgi:hypothetical protein
VFHGSAAARQFGGIERLSAPWHFGERRYVTLRGISTMRILVVEDERKVASFIKRGLEAANYAVDVEHDGPDN